MYQMLEHPDISCALRTGYPRGVRDLDVDDDVEDYDDEDEWE